MSVEHGAMSNVMLFDNTDLQMRNLIIPISSNLIGKNLHQVNEAIDATFLVPIMLRDDTHLIPSGDTIFEGNELLYVIATEEDFNVILKSFNKPIISLKNVAII